MGQSKLARVAVSSAIFAIDKAYDYLVPEKWLDAVQPGRRVIVPFGSGNRRAEGIIFSVVPQETDAPVKAIEYVYEDECPLTQEQLSLALWMKKRYFCTLFEGANAQLPPGLWDKQREWYVPGDLPAEQAIKRAGKGKKAAVTAAVYSAGKPMKADEIAALCGIGSPGRLLSALVADGIIAQKIEIQRKVADKTVKMYTLAMPYIEALEQLGRGKLAEKRAKVLTCIRDAGGSLPAKEIVYQTGVSEGLLRSLARAGVLHTDTQPLYRRVEIARSQPVPPIELSAPQAEVFRRARAMLDAPQPGMALLHGITGSGKTLVYIELIRETLKKGKNAILLVPEIALTPQILRQFSHHFGDDIAVLHSALTTAQRVDEYRRIRTGQAHVALGTRSAVFAPLESLGIVIVDEEQELSYQSESSPRYDAIEVARYRCHKDGALLLLGSATPSASSYYHAMQGEYPILSLTQRYKDAPLPAVTISDMRAALLDGNASLIGNDLYRQLQETFDRKQQAVLFINRRGSARLALCADCGYVPECENCSVALTYHSRNGRLMCHHCGYSKPFEPVCPQCGGSHMQLIGAGTQKVEEELHALFPGIRVIRMDADTTTGRTSHERLLDSFAKGEADVLLGTQMVAKGLDFDNVTMVGVLDADLSLFSGDYHAQERTFSLLTQVVGRAGRRETPGRAVIQTYHPNHAVIRAAAAQDYRQFYDYEIQSREALKAPPFADIFVFQISAVRENDALRAALRIAGILSRAMQGPFCDLQTAILGPAPCFILRLNNKYRYTVSFRGTDGKRERELVAAVLTAFYRSAQGRAAAVTASRNPPI